MSGHHFDLEFDFCMWHFDIGQDLDHKIMQEEAGRHSITFITHNYQDQHEMMCIVESAFVVSMENHLSLLFKPFSRSWPSPCHCGWQLEKSIACIFISSLRLEAIEFTKIQ